MQRDDNIETPEPAPIGGRNILSVSEITAHIKETMEAGFSDVCVQGEISQLKCASSGHIYMTLKDDRAVLKAVIWRSVAAKIKYDMAQGLEVICRGAIDVYPPHGSYQMIVREVYPCGMGSLQLAFKQLVERLRKEGLFSNEYKRPLPSCPERIGIITSPTGAALHDVLRIIRRRWPPADIYLLPAPVQGEGAAARIAESLDLLNRARPDLDVIILTRGGGSLEDLWAFNEECVARAIFRSRIPVVSAVGHEVDFSISDFTADMRAATPSEAGEKTVPDCAEMQARTALLARRLGRALMRKVEMGRARLNAFADRHVIRHPQSLLQERAMRADEIMEKIKAATAAHMERKKQRLDFVNGKLNALSPLKVLQRGYSITFGPDGRPILDSGAVSKDETIETMLNNGRLKSRVTDIQ